MRYLIDKYVVFTGGIVGSITGVLSVTYLNKNPKQLKQSTI